MPQAERIEIVSYHSEWPRMFEREAGPLKLAFGENLIALHHFGSTSIPFLCAKPKIDILAVVKQLSKIDISDLQKLGFADRGEVIVSGRYFSKENPKIHLHVFEEGNPNIERNLIFRDWLRTHENDRNAYASLKKDLAARYDDGMEYCRAKTDFITQIINQALNKAPMEIRKNERT